MPKIHWRTYRRIHRNVNIQVEHFKDANSSSNRRENYISPPVRFCSENSKNHVNMNGNFEKQMANPSCSKDFRPGEVIGEVEKNFDLSSESDEEFTSFDILHELRSWTNKHNLPLNAISDLLKILRRCKGLENLPLDARTLLRTPRYVKQNIKLLNPHGQYIHFGVGEGISHSLKNTNEEIPDPIELYLNVDGLPISKSSNSQLWPVLGSIARSNIVFPIGIYHGNEKPKNANDLMVDTVNDLISLHENGLIIKEKKHKVQLKGLICDAPARAFVMSIKNHSGYFGCSKCCQEGEYLEHRVCFPEIDSNLRTDDSFIEKLQEEHHTGDTIMLSIPQFKPITHVPYEYMHLVCLGVMRKLIQLWVRGEPKKKRSFKLPSLKIEEISNFLIQLQSCITSDFSRKPRSLNFIDRWKATELRQMLLYTGPLVLQSALRQDLYIHFLLLHCAIRIFADSSKSHLHAFAHEMLKSFVMGFGELYGHEHVSYNVHGLIHIFDDVKEFGSLDEYGAFKFENFMKGIKKKIHKHEKPLPQIASRIYEERNCEQKGEEVDSRIVCVTHEHSVGPSVTKKGKQYKKLKLNGILFETQKPNNFCLLHDDTVIEIYNFVKDCENIYIVGRKFLTKKNTFVKPCESSLMDIWKVEKPSRMMAWQINLIKRKCIALTKDANIVVASILNSDLKNTQ